jgi:uncharacterized protein
MASEGLHESEEALGTDVIDVHRILASLMEELEAVDWYNQRAKATGDESLRAVLEHNRDEEKEHAAMALEWLRRRDAAFDRHLRTYLFTERPLGAIERAAKGSEAGAPLPTEGSLAIGSLRQAGK